MYNDLTILTNDFKWTPMQKQKGRAPSPRHSMTINLYKNQLILMGGELQFNPTKKRRDFTNEVYTFDLQKKEWKMLCVDVRL